MFSFGFICLFSVIGSSLSMVAYDCNSKSVNLTVVSLVTTPTCDQSVVNITARDVLVAITQTTEHIEIPFIRCHIETNNYMGRCGKTIDTYHEGGLFSEIIQVSRTDCETMIRDKRLRVIKNGEAAEITLNEGGYPKLSYVSRGYVSDGACSPGSTLYRNGRQYDRPLINTELVAKYSTGKAMIDVEEKLIRFPNGNTCAYQDEHCFDSDYGNMFWSVALPQCFQGEEDKT